MTADSHYSPLQFYTLREYAEAMRIRDYRTALASLVRDGGKKHGGKWKISGKVLNALLDNPLPVGSLRKPNQSIEAALERLESMRGK